METFFYFITHFGIIIGQSDANILSGGAIGGITVGIFVVVVLATVLLLCGKCMTIFMHTIILSCLMVCIWKFF